ncbi:glycosyltransferase family 4 protein [Sulfurimonas sp.]|jgi:UDP-N-acetylmuramyl pentapeptide phosphotransferase/UDP-N-acetylglucosamine-1-phosphate transferase|uniref:MraY family glycosyltransferase n=1 Tax=Sulfurimonas sp. TaxID=2022749 RepID=UPI0025FE2A5F|nr:glycosyltransferase family 4 protein [Sulfurimonas sp.]MBT5935913.1 glycosyltransferase family 4 protein [Sulfurimonas sp.]
MIYIILLIISFSLTYFIKNYYIKHALLEEINERSSHTVPTPHGGGIAIILVWFSGLFYLHFTNEIDSSLFYALLVGIIISVVSFFDDLYELSPKLRLIAQAIVAFGGLYFLGGFEQLNLFFFTLENQILTNIFAFFMIIWFINLYNFLDGIDGYAGSEALFLSIAAFILFGGAHFLVLAVAVLGFLVWNWHRAKIFMGDVGSTLLGYNVAIFTIYYANQVSTNFWIWIILFGLFWFDATLTLFRRYKNKEKLSQAHKKHAYQRLVQSGLSHDKVVLFSLGVNAMLFIMVYFAPSVFIALPLSLIVMYGCVKFIDTKKGFS